jgi:flagellar basal-body rod protein FlgC
MMPSTAISLSGMNAATVKLNASASNLANAGDTSRVGGPPGYSPLSVQNSATPGGGVTAVATTMAPGQMLAFDPSSVMANPSGLVDTPEIDPVNEISNQIAAGHAFAFSLEALQVADEEQQTLLDIKT